MDFILLHQLYGQQIRLQSYIKRCENIINQTLKVVFLIKQSIMYVQCRVTYPTVKDVCSVWCYWSNSHGCMFSVVSIMYVQCCVTYPTVMTVFSVSCYWSNIHGWMFSSCCYWCLVPCWWSQSQLLMLILQARSYDWYCCWSNCQKLVLSTDADRTVKKLCQGLFFGAVAEQTVKGLCLVITKIRDFVWCHC